MSSDPHKLTPTEVHAVASLLAAVKRDDASEARWWSERPALLSALAKMRKQAKESAS